MEEEEREDYFGEEYGGCVYGMPRCKTCGFKMACQVGGKRQKRAIIAATMTAAAAIARKTTTKEQAAVAKQPLREHKMANVMWTPKA